MSIDDSHQAPHQTVGSYHHVLLQQQQQGVVAAAAAGAADKYWLLLQIHLKIRPNSHCVGKCSLDSAAGALS
jgi:hypothetical protein